MTTFDTMAALLAGHRPAWRLPHRMRREYRVALYSLAVVVALVSHVMITDFKITALVVAGLTGGALNSMAAGGGVLTLLALLAIGLPPQVAVATSQTVIWTSFAGGILPAWRNRSRYRALWPSLATAATGTGLGVWLVTLVDAHTFKMITPVLMACAALLLLVQPAMQKLIDARHARRQPTAVPAATRAEAGTRITRREQTRIAITLGLTALYAGAFGGGVAVAVLLVFAFLSPWAWHEANDVKNFTCLIMSLVCGFVFAVTGLTAPVPALVLAGSLFLGGLGGQRLARKVPAATLRKAVAVLTLGGALAVVGT